MDMVELGRTGLRVSELCLGTMTWGSQNTEAEAHAQIDRAREAGLNFMDTAEMYPTTPMRRVATMASIVRWRRCSRRGRPPR